MLTFHQTLLSKRFFGVRFNRLYQTTSTRLKIVPKNLKGKTKSSQEWLTRHLNDPYVKKAQELNYRARSAFKLIEMDDKIKILKPGMIVVECGASPGAWTQVIVQRINSDGKNARKAIGKVIGIDLLPIDPLPGATFFSGCDFTVSETQVKIIQALQINDEQNNEGISHGPSLDVVMSDMAPNASGMPAVDHPRIIGLARKALTFAEVNGKVGSHFLTKIWDGNETKMLEADLEKLYNKVGRLKPSSSRNDSAEVFLFGKSMKPRN